MNSPSTSSSANAPRLLPSPPDEAAGAERSVFDLLLSARRAVLGSPAAARGLHDLLVARGPPLRRHSSRSTSSAMRSIGSEAVENLRRVWETVSLNVLDGPAAPNATPNRLGRASGRRRHRAWPRRYDPGSPRPEGFA